MTAIQKVKNKLWQYKFNTQDMTDHKFIHAYDLVVEGIYRVAVRETKTLLNFDNTKIDILAEVAKGKIVFYKYPWVLGKKVHAETVDTSPLTIFIKDDRRKHTSRVLRRKTSGTRKSRTTDKS